MKAVQANKKYHFFAESLVRRLCEQVIQQGKSGKSAVKAVRNKLHQVGNAYFTKKTAYEEAVNQLATLPKDLHHPAVIAYCQELMTGHASTQERIPILETFYSTCMDTLPPIHSVLDLACGFNPLALPWMPLDPACQYFACDIYSDLITFLQTFFDHFNLGHQASQCDLIDHPPERAVDLALLLKVIPCLEQVEKEIGLKLLSGIKARFLLVSFPVRSLGGKKKGMTSFYQEHFMDMISATSWETQTYLFASELAFLIKK